MTSPATAVDTPHGRIYLNPLRDPSPEYFSVTRAISAGVPKNLENWFKRSTAEYAVDNKAVWENLPRDAAVDLVKREADRIRDAAADRGSVVHAILEAAATGQRPDRTWKPEIGSYVDAGLRFLDEWQPEIVWCEVTVYSDTHLYAGTGDLIARLPALGLGWLDWKTSTDIYAETGLQLAAYRHAEYALVDNTETPIPATTFGAAVHLRSDGTYSLVPLRCGPEQHDTFIHALHVARFTSDGWKHMRGQPLTAPTLDVIAGERKAWLVNRVEYLRDNHPGALDSLAAMWPPGVPTLRQDGHTPEQVEQIRQVVVQVEAAFDVPFGRPDPLTDTLTTETRDAIRGRLQALPPDLLDTVTAKAKQAGVPHIAHPLFSRGHLQRLDPLITDAEDAVRARKEEAVRLATEFLDNDPDITLALLALVGVEGDTITFDQLKQFAALCETVTGGLFEFQHTGETWTVVCPDAEAALIGQHGSKSAVLAVCREIAGRYGRPPPRSAATAAGDPVLVALALSTSTTNPDTQEKAS